MTTIADDFAQAKAGDEGAAGRLVARIAQQLGTSRCFRPAEQVEASANLQLVLWKGVRQRGLNRFPTVESMIAYYRRRPQVLRKQAFPDKGSRPLWDTCPGNERVISFPGDDPDGKVNRATERQLNVLEVLERREWFHSLLDTLSQPERDLVVSWAEGNATPSEPERCKRFRIITKLKQKICECDNYDNVVITIVSNKQKTVR